MIGTYSTVEKPRHVQRYVHYIVEDQNLLEVRRVSHKNQQLQISRLDNIMSLSSRVRMHVYI